MGSAHLGGEARAGCGVRCRRDKSSGFFSPLPVQSKPTITTLAKEIVRRIILVGLKAYKYRWWFGLEVVQLGHWSVMVTPSESVADYCRGNCSIQRQLLAFVTPRQYVEIYLGRTINNAWVTGNEGLSCFQQKYYTKIHVFCQQL